MGRPSKATEWLTEERLNLIRMWCRDGLTEEQIAHKIDVGVSTFSEWKKRYPKLQDALKEGKEFADSQVENALFQAAIAGNTTAQIFWLKNRRRDKWADHPTPVFAQIEFESDPLSLAFEELENER